MVNLLVNRMCVGEPIPLPLPHAYFAPKTEEMCPKYKKYFYLLVAPKKLMFLGFGEKFKIRVNFLKTTNSRKHTQVPTVVSHLM